LFIHVDLDLYWGTPRCGLGDVSCAATLHARGLALRDRRERARRSEIHAARRLGPHRWPRTERTLAHEHVALGVPTLRVEV